MIKIVYGEKKIFLTSSFKEDVLDLNSPCMVVFNPSAERIRDIMDQFIISEFPYLLIQGNEAMNLTHFKKAFKTIKAGGGVVRNSKDEFLFIYRHKKWDLPKGKCEEKEEIEECAVREVMEETGLTQIQLEEPLLVTYHCYLEEQLYLKETHWYSMRTNDFFVEPQQEEGITKVIWVHPHNIHFQLEKTYESVRDIFRLLLER